MLSLVAVTFTIHVSMICAIWILPLCSKRTADTDTLRPSSPKNGQPSPHRMMSQQEEEELLQRLKPRVIEPKSDEEKKQIEAIKAGRKAPGTSENTLDDAHEDFTNNYYIAKNHTSSRERRPKKPNEARQSKEAQSKAVKT
ncbi:hypothetical protein L596_015390 [Steinernema carpocapsae]|uniref:Uncharacterized protein n=1 Tax=Steinernema carpocapsae TaxID=34508 RepID=A0A4U5NFQ2_STECR|nr:hypothetical protein L596_015390 [Steinernema carpocapsae]